ncbi:MAG: DUF5718 family protein [Sulfurimonas sp.]
MLKYSEYLGLGIAGNFALHLAQAGELEEFKDIITAEEAAPKGMFPFYLPNNPKTSAKEILKTYPLSVDTIKLPKENVNIQAEPEVGLVCDIIYKDKKISQIIPTHFGAYNDCSVRVAGASKISDKKNWGESSKGFSDTLFEIDKFSKSGIMDSFSICSFLKRNNKLRQYGENVELSGYSYFYEKLTHWMINQLNTQEDFGPLENLSDYISACSYPSKALISIGATRYTPYGEETFLKSNDEVIIVVYNSKKLSLEDIENAIDANNYDSKTMSVLSQKVITDE